MPSVKQFLDPIRPTVRAVIRRDGRLLVQVKQKPGGRPFLSLPGGRQEPGETLDSAVARECFEEIGAKVTVGAVVHVAEVFKSKQDKLRHQVEILFSCTVPDNYVARMGSAPGQIAD